MIQELDFRRFELIRTCGVYKAHSCNDTASKDADFVIEVGIGRQNLAKDAPISVKLYSKGEIKELQIGLWQVSPVAEGHIHYPGYYSKTTLRVTCIDPMKQEVVIEMQQDSCLNHIELAEAFFNRIHMLADIEDKKNFEQIHSSLFNSFRTFPKDAINGKICEFTKLYDFVSALEAKDSCQSLSYCKQHLKQRLNELNASADKCLK